jgi:hypothetical protein
MSRTIRRRMCLSSNLPIFHAAYLFGLFSFFLYDLRHIGWGSRNYCLGATKCLTKLKMQCFACSELYPPASPCSVTYVNPTYLCVVTLHLVCDPSSWARGVVEVGNLQVGTVKRSMLIDREASTGDSMILAFLQLTAFHL